MAASKQEAQNSIVSGGAPPARPPLRPYQARGAEFLVNAKTLGVILGDFLGLGKTRQVLEAVERIGGPILVVATGPGRFVWAEEIEKWLDGKTYVILTGQSPKPTPLVDFTLVAWDILQYWAPLLHSGFNVVVADEAHRLSNWQSKRSIAFEAVATGRRRILVTNNPMRGRPENLYNLVRLCDPHRTGRFWGKRGWAERFCNARKKFIRMPGGGFKEVWDTGGISNPEGLRTTLDGILLRRLRSDVGEELPTVTTQVVPMEVPDKVHVQLQRMERNIKTYFESVGELERASKAEKGKGVVTISEMLKLATNAKLQQTIEFLTDLVVSKSKPLVCANYLKTVHDISTAFNGSSLVIDGSVPSARVVNGRVHSPRMELVERFSSDESVNMLVAQIDTVSESLNITAADAVVFADVASWDPLKYTQAAGRPVRLTRSKPVTVYWLIAEGTVEEIVYEVVAAKMMVEAAITDGKPVPTGFDGPVEEEILKRLLSTPYRERRKRMRLRRKEKARATKVLQGVA